VSAVRGWLELIRERFPPGAYLPMVTLFVLGNGAAALRATGVDLHAWRIAAAFALTLVCFFRLRCFDEIKDYDTDCRINPTRPLPRGVLGVGQVKAALYLLAGVEVALAATLGPAVLSTHAVTIGFSFLMYREFFIGRHLRPHLTTYAVTHTFVSVLLGYSIAAAATGVALYDLPVPLLLFGGVNWLLFNLFEFARKTYAPTEERAEVDTYSSLFGAAGAAALSVSQVAGAVALVAYLSPQLLPARAALWHVPAAVALAGAAVAYAARARPPLAAAVRGGAGLYIVAFYGLLTYQLWG
jgi:4-hydroxybenzoate polyprenyltransferase